MNIFSINITPFRIISITTAIVLGTLYAALWSGAARSSSAATSIIATYTPIEDTYIRKSYPNTNYNTASSMNVEAGSSEKRALLKFNLSSLPADAQIEQVQLKLYATNGSANGGTIYAADSNWSGSQVTWNTAPAVGQQVATISKVSSNTWVTTAILPSSIPPSRVISWYINTPSSDAVYYASLESSNKPTLLITYKKPGSTTPTQIVTTTSSPTTLTPTPANTNTPTPISSGSDPVVMAAGDIACDPASSSFRGGEGTSSSCRMKATADLIAAQNPAAVLALGDVQYYCGSYTAFMQSYNLSWGKLKNITYPAVGNHEFLTSGAADCTTANAGADGYFTYYGSVAGGKGRGFYSFSLGAWHLVSLNTNCSEAGGCGKGSPQYTWLENELKTHTNKCVMAFYHIPLYSSGGRSNQNSKSMYQLLYDYNADLVLTGHDHTYERFAPQDANGVRDDVRGIRSFVVGTGGSNHTSFTSIFPNSEVRNADTFGALKVTLRATSYDWEFMPEPGKTFTDRGTQACH